MTDVFLTVDTELSMSGTRVDRAWVREALDRDVFGRTRRGDYGLGFQLRLLREAGLNATFFVEALSASAVGLDSLREIVDAVLGQGLEVQLHVHTEWLARMERSPLPGRVGQHLWQFNEDEQATLISVAKDNLARAGAEGTLAFRAGNYGADRATLRALARNGIAFDTSHNATAADSRIGLDPEASGPSLVEGVWELPVTIFEDWPRHRRHAQLTAVSYAELAAMLDQAYAAGRSTFVVVSHGFELLNQRRDAPDPTMLRRFERLCRLLADARSRFETRRFDSYEPKESPRGVAALRSPVARTALRYAEQALRRRHG
ncbi:MAG: polysaccharide deacetylase [Alphaproteobacteria bacterium]